MLITTVATAMVSDACSCLSVAPRSCPTHPYSSRYFAHTYISSSFFSLLTQTQTVVSYIVSGRVDEASEWFVISEGDLPWRTGPYPDRNDQGLEIVSTYESGDDTHAYTEVTFEENAAAFIHYKVQFPDSRNGGDALQFSEVELPGYLQ